MTEFKLNTEAVAAIFMAGLILVSMLQFLQLGGLSKGVANLQAASGQLKEAVIGYSGQGSSAAVAQAPAAQGGASNLPKSLQGLPDMVGGC